MTISAWIDTWCIAGALLAQEAEGMTAGGWLVMLLSVSSVLVLVAYCLTKVLSLPPVEEESLKGPLEIDTEDRG